MTVLSPLLDILKRPALIAGALLAAVVGGLWWQVEAKTAQLAAAQDRLQSAAQRNAALRDSLQRDTSYADAGVLRSVYSMTDSVGTPTEEDATAPVTEGGRDITEKTTAVYEGDSAVVSGVAQPEAPDTRRYEFRAQAGRYGLTARLMVRPAGALDYRFVVDPPPVEIRIYQTAREGPSGATITETHFDVPNGRVRALHTTRPSVRRPPASTSPWSYGVGASATLDAVHIGPRLDYTKGPLYVSLSAGYAPPALRRNGAAAFSHGIDVGVMF